VGVLTNDTFAQRLDRAILRSEKAKLVEAPVIEVNDE
jgi:hypothetical protein